MTATAEAERRLFASTLFDLGLSGRVESSAGTVDAAFALPCGGRFHLVAIPFGPAEGQAYFCQLHSWEDPLQVLGRDLSRWRLIRGWNARRAPDAPQWSGDAATVCREAASEAARWAALRGPSRRAA